MNALPATESKIGRRVTIAVVAVLGAIIALNLAARGLDHAVGGSEPSGVAGSSYGTQDSGLAAVASLVARFGHPVAHQRGALAGTTLDPTSTVFVIVPEALGDEDDATLLEYVSEGGRLVIGGPDPFYLRRLRDRAPRWSANGDTTYATIDSSFRGVRRIETTGAGSWASAGSGSTIVRSGTTALLTRDRVGRGQILFLADVSPLVNAYLARADDAAFALALAGDPARPVVFAEGPHGYGESRGLRAIPTPWKISLVILAAAALVIAWSRSRRFGPPDRPSRELPPARAEYVRALAVTLERTRDPAAALAPMQQWARSHVARRANLRPDATPEAIDRAAITLGFSEPERAAMWYPPTDDDSALALGRLVASLSQHDGRTA